ncbi:hypothetical protein NDU88_006378 [Pleurodeles waltl]|uniref:Uncharacterized protein n=1 Tax=Pleurodeles waltl TaxID=8319 RepID=A0AAV7TFF2_PLEWA|nr:hypothetical protein NDU88_006378 [Pleurodeles waltl]
MARASGAGMRLLPCPASGPGKGILPLDHSVSDARWLAGGACQPLEPAVRRSESGRLGWAWTRPGALEAWSWSSLHAC